MKALALVSFAIAAIAPVAAVNAATSVLNGDTTGGPTFNRPLAGSPPAGLSAVGTAVHYQATTFTVSAGGSYDFLSVATTYDNFLGLYSGSFNPSSPLTNAIVYNDDDPTIGLSGFTVNLLAGTSYIVLATGFENDDFGAYTLTLDGPGTASFDPGAGGVPEPATWGLMILGFGMVGAAARRRRAMPATA